MFELCIVQFHTFSSSAVLISGIDDHSLGTVQQRFITTKHIQLKEGSETCISVKTVLQH